MSTPDFSSFGMDYDDLYMQSLEAIKTITITRNEALYLSDSVTLLLEHDTDQGQIAHVPARHLIGSSLIAVPVEVIERIGLAVLLTTDPDNTSQTTTISMPLAD